MPTEILASQGWRQAWRPSPIVQPGTFSGQRQWWKNSIKEDLLVARCFCGLGGGILLGDLLGVFMSSEWEYVSLSSLISYRFCSGSEYFKVITFVFGSSSVNVGFGSCSVLCGVWFGSVSCTFYYRNSDSVRFRFWQILYSGSVRSCWVLVLSHLQYWWFFFHIQYCNKYSWP